MLYRNDNRSVTLTLSDMKFMWERDKAYLLKCPSVDRIDDSRGYEVDNCRFIEAWINKGTRSEVSKQQLITKEGVMAEVVNVQIGVDRVLLDKALAAQKLRIVPMGAVTVEQEVLVKALAKIVPGNEARNVAKRVMERLIKEGKQYGEVEKDGGSDSPKSD